MSTNEDRSLKEYSTELKNLTYCKNKQILEKNFGQASIQSILRLLVTCEEKENFFNFFDYSLSVFIPLSRVAQNGRIFQT